MRVCGFLTGVVGTEPKIVEKEGRSPFLYFRVDAMDEHLITSVHCCYYKGIDRMKDQIYMGALVTAVGSIKADMLPSRKNPEKMVPILKMFVSLLYPFEMPRESEDTTGI